MENVFVGPPVEDSDILSMLPREIAESVRIKNGYIAADGAFHVRGACRSPLWHSLRHAWQGSQALHELYPSVLPTDIPLAQDCFGDQYLLRDESVAHLSGETGEVEPLEIGWFDFVERVEADPIEFLGVQQFQRFRHDGGVLLPGQLLSVYPPFVADSTLPRSIRAIAALELVSWLADFARQIRNIPDGGQIRIKVV
jgi:hypothetical protein